MNSGPLVDYFDWRAVRDVDWTSTTGVLSAPGTICFIGLMGFCLRIDAENKV